MKKINKPLFALVALSIVFASSAAMAQSAFRDLSNNNDQLIKAFRKYQDIKKIDIQVPTVVELPIADNYMERYDFMVLDQTNDQAQPYYFKRNQVSEAVPISLTSVPVSNGLYKMIDDKSNTYTDFVLPEDRQGTVEIIIRSSTPITSSAIKLLLDANVALPNTAELKAVVNGVSTIVLSEQKMTNQMIRFPKTVSSEWHLYLKYGQPLRINDLNLVQENITVSNNQSIRWLAQANHNYRIYLDPDRYLNIRTSESGNLSSNQDILLLPPTTSMQNPLYTQADVDNDGVPDTLDNCVSIQNSDQVDINRNGRGDACDDFDKDGLINTIDNCPNDPNRNQSDIDSDGKGDVCDQEESRVTERLPWLPWMGIVFAVIVIAVLFTITAKSKPHQE